MDLATKKGRNRILFSMLIVLIWGGIVVLISTATTIITGLIMGWLILNI